MSVTVSVVCCPGAALQRTFLVSPMVAAMSTPSNSGVRIALIAGMGEVVVAVMVGGPPQEAHTPQDLMDRQYNGYDSALSSSRPFTTMWLFSGPRQRWLRLGIPHLARQPPPQRRPHGFGPD